MASEDRTQSIANEPNRALRRFIEKRSGIPFALLIATPVSAILWAAIILLSHMI